MENPQSSFFVTFNGIAFDILRVSCYLCDLKAMCAVLNGIIWQLCHVQSVFFYCNSGIEITFGICFIKFVKVLFVFRSSISAAHILIQSHVSFCLPMLFQQMLYVCAPAACFLPRQRL